jgi:hypothetical protein
MAALLMPQRIFKQVVRKRMSLLNLSDVVEGSPAANSLASAIASDFLVSKQAAMIRLGTEGVLLTS